jgi:hypothetical protein
MKADEDCQNMTPQSMPLWHIDCFETKALKKQKEQSCFLKAGAKSI